MFFGREDQLKQLADLLKRPIASLVTCRGRRRIGKSTLIEEFARRNSVRLLKMEGLSPRVAGSNAKQLAAFSRQLAEQSQLPDRAVSTWFDAFARLDDAIDDTRPMVVFLDEISWMGKYDPDFPGEFKYAWDNRFRKHPKLVMVICGSVSTWITKNILRSKGFVGRPTLNLTVGELPLADCRCFWGKRADRIAATEIFDLLSVTGGVPKYLELIDPKLSAAENVRRLCFTPGGLLTEEFDDIFSDVFEGKSTVNRRILEALAEGPMSGKEISEALGIENNGHLSDYLEELEITGFVAKDAGINPQTGGRVKLVRYRIVDNYTRFYLKYIEPRLDLVKKGIFELTDLEQLPGWSSVLGLQFESLMLNSIPALLKEFGVDGGALISAAPYRRNAHSRGEGCQIDLLLQTRRSVWVVEFKRKAEIGTEVVDEVSQKVRRLGVRQETSVRTALVYVGRLSPAVEAEGYFDAVVDASRLLRG